MKKIFCHGWKGLPAVVAATLFFLLTSSGTTWAREALIAMGSVEANGVLERSASPINGVVQSSRSGAGQYTVTVIAAGAFAGTTSASYLAALSARATTSSDNLVNGRVVSVTDDVLTLQVRASDVEDSAFPNLALPEDTRFYFQIHRIDPGGARIDGDSRYLLAAGSVTSGGDKIASFATDGIAVTTANLGPGEYTIQLTKSGAFVGDATDDYLLFLTPRGGGGVSDEAARGSATAVVSDDSVLFEVYTDDVQQAAAGNSPTPENEPFEFSIHRIDAAGAAGIPASRLVLAMASIDSTGALLSGGVRGGAGTLSASRLSEGLYRLEIDAPGAFNGVIGDRYVVNAFNHGTDFQDELVGASLAVVDADTLRVSLGSTDVEIDGENTGVLADLPITVIIYDTDPGFAADLAISAKRAPGSFKGTDFRNASGAGQSIRLALVGTRPRKFFFLSENAGHLTDGTAVKGFGIRGALRSGFFRTTGGRANVTAAIRSGTLVASDLRPGTTVRFEGRTAYRDSDSRPKRNLRLMGRSASRPAAVDQVKVKVLAK